MIEAEPVTVNENEDWAPNGHWTLPLQSHCSKRYPVAGVSEIVTCVPAAYEPDPGETVPPAEGLADSVNVYCEGAVHVAVSVIALFIVTDWKVSLPV